MSTAPVITKESIIADTRATIARLVACADSNAGNDVVLAWKHGLGVKMVDGKAAAVCLDHADSFVAQLGPFAFPVVMNGFRETATPQLRKQAIADYLPKLEESLKLFEEA